MARVLVLLLDFTALLVDLMPFIKFKLTVQFQQWVLNVRVMLKTSESGPINTVLP